MPRLLENKSSRSANFMSLKDGDKKKVRLLFDGPVRRPDGSTFQGTQLPFGSWWHRMKEDATKGRKYHDWLCIGQFRNCPLCIENGAYEAANPAAEGKKVENKLKPWPMKKKTDVNAWSYEMNKVVIISLGNDLWDKLKTIEEAKGKDIDQFDVMLTRKGQGITTTYDAVPMDEVAFSLPEGNFLFDLEAETAKSERGADELNEVISGDFDRKQGQDGGQRQAGAPAGGDVNAAMAVVMTFGAHAGRTLGDVFKSEPNYLTWLMSNSTDPNIAQAASIILAASAPKPLAPPPVAPLAPAPLAPPAAPAALAPPAAPLAPPAAPEDPFAALSAPAAAPPVDRAALETQVRTIAASKPDYRNPANLKAKLQAVTSRTLDIKAFTVEELQKLIAIL